jgi:hypothetical protein
MGQVAAQVKRGEDPNKKLKDLSEAREQEEIGSVSLVARIQEAACCHKTVYQLVRNAEALETWPGLHVCFCPDREGMTLLRKHFQCKA